MTNVQVTLSYCPSNWRSKIKACWQSPRCKDRGPVSSHKDIHLLPLFCHWSFYIFKQFYKNIVEQVAVARPGVLELMVVSHVNHKPYIIMDLRFFIIHRTKLFWTLLSPSEFVLPVLCKTLNYIKLIGGRTINIFVIYFKQQKADFKK
jgi:hypothetical protein